MTPRSIVDVFESHTEARPDLPVLRFLEDGEVDGPVSTATFTALRRRARSIGAALAERTRPGDRVLLVFPPGLGFVETLLGSFYAGVIAVPAYPPDLARLERSLERLKTIASDSGATLALTTSEFLPLAESITEGHAHLTWLATDTVPEDDRAPYRADANDVAFLQYTSGSTGDPRGVRLTHGNLLANSARIRECFGHDETSRGVIWLPPYHDMGLIGGILQPLYTGFEVMLLSPMHFLQHPARWLKAVSAFRATTSGGPNFAYELSLRAFANGGHEALDLSSWTVAFNGAEPIRAETLERFSAAFAPCGFRKEALYPCYGLAEATLIVTGPAPQSGARAFGLDADGLRTGRVVASTSTDARRLVGCGDAGSEGEVAIVDPEECVRAPQDRVGEIWVRGPSVADGYHGRPEASAQTFGARLAGDDRAWLRTGDLGAFVDGQLVVTGRRKDLLIVRGRNHYPQDIERTAESAHPSVRAGCVAAFSVEGADGERAVVVAEVRKGAEGEAGAILPAVRSALAQAHELFAELVLVPAGTLTKTSSGKLQRSATRERFLAADLPLLAVASGSVHDTSVAVYGPLDEHFEKLDKRRPSYRYDLETDIPWDRIDEAGDCFGPTYLRRMGIDVEALRSEPEAWELFQWGMSNVVCRTFEALEELVLAFIRGEAARLGERRSIALFDEEEEKHIATFRRYAAHVAPRRPELVHDLDVFHRSYHAELHRLADPARYASAAEHHYTVWLLFCFFEELTVVMHELFAADPGMQPTWLAVHRAHKQEEQQHVITDHAFLQAIEATDEERYAWSRAAFDDLLRITMGLSERDFALGLVRRRFPALAARLVQRSDGAPLNVALLREGHFPRTCAAGPYFAAMARDPGDRHAVRVTEGPLVEWLRGWLEARLGQPVSVDTPFTHYGLDSLHAMELSGELERRLGRRISPTVAYEHPTIALLAGALGQAEGKTDAAVAVDGPHARAERLLALDARFPGLLPDAITAVYEAPACATDDLERALHAVATRHPALQHGWRAEDGRFKRVTVPFAPIVTVQATPETFRETVARVAAEQDKAAFDLTAFAPWRATRVVAPDAAALVLTVHHVATDGWSMGIVHGELATALRGKPLSPVPPLDMAADEARFLPTPEAAARLGWWRARLAGHPRLDEAPRPPEFRGGRVSRVLTAAEYEPVKRFAHRVGVSPFEVMLTAWHRVQAGHEGSDDVLVQTHLVNRRSDAERRAVGYRVNVLPLRTKLAGAVSFEDTLDRVRRSWMGALDHELPIDHLVRELWPERWLARWMPARWAFNHIPWTEDATGAEDVLPRPEDVLPTPQFLFFDGMLVARPRPDGLRLTLWHDLDVVSEADAERLLDGFLAELPSRATGRRPQPESRVNS